MSAEQGAIILFLLLLMFPAVLLNLAWGQVDAARHDREFAAIRKRLDGLADALDVDEDGA